ncbi:1-acyl-sn-glycerol-3-phosphate acyltransferase [Hankyongella ginsenosidimutans]|uniref:1-acyl-sn-glycerol-3-phosphate acyltransferase n=1 Tax=Hankyongella ginsenosidimutans TaxID=1763828 RepID=A0A4D7CA54_9SPHN|nr:lysophospholipid acyltransferase family protein [Hankyongella ginsenosidimutans]QCI80087.1 1-acyl-sn-glycerol-3-phosphate acyltransferase [Hankyongella ginsenosidimutans]
MLVLVRVVVGIRVEGPDLRDLPAGPVILAPKHQSSLDVIIMVAQPCSPVFVLKRELRRMPVIGWYAVRGGHILVDRDAGRRRCAPCCTQQRRRSPRGGRWRSSRGHAHAAGCGTGAEAWIVAVASQLGATVVPIALNSGLCWGRKQFLKRPGVVAVVAHPPLAASLGRKTMLAALYAGINSLNHEDARR